jgi:hypothetical protein
VRDALGVGGVPARVAPVAPNLEDVFVAATLETASDAA